MTTPAIFALQLVLIAACITPVPTLLGGLIALVVGAAWWYGVAWLLSRNDDI